MSAGFSRRELLTTGILASASALSLVLLYYLVPAQPRPHEAVGWRLVVVLVAFGVSLSHELTAIFRHHQPLRRAVIALSFLFPLFIVGFAWLYLAMSRSEASSFSEPLNHTSALYFTVTVLSTVGFGDISPRTDGARITVMIQMLCDLALIAVVVRLIFGAASRAEEQRVAGD